MCEFRREINIVAAHFFAIRQSNRLAELRIAFFNFSFFFPCYSVRKTAVGVSWNIRKVFVGFKHRFVHIPLILFSFAFLRHIKSS